MFRGTVRWCRRTVSATVLLILVAFLVVNQIGLPNFIKQPLLDQLRSRGAELDFSRMRIRLGRGIVMEKVNLRRAGEAVGERVFVEQLQLKLRWVDLVSFQIPTITAVTLHGGKLTLPLENQPGLPSFQFSVDGVEARLRFDSDLHWVLERFDATCHGGRLRVSGDVVLKPRAKTSPRQGEVAWQRVVLKLGQTLDAMRFRGVPTLEITGHVDLVRPSASFAEVRLTADGFQWKDLAAETIRIEGSIAAAMESAGNTNAVLKGQARIELAGVRTPQGEARSSTVTARADLAPDTLMPVRGGWVWKVTRATTPWGTAVAWEAQGDVEPTAAPRPGFRESVRASVTQWVGPWGSLPMVRLEATLPSVPTFVPDGARLGSIQWRAVAERAAVREGTAGRLEFSGMGNQVEETAMGSGGSLWPLEPLRQWNLDTRLSLNDLTLPNLKLDSASTEPRWQGGRLTFSNLVVKAYDGSARADVLIDSHSREARAKVVTQLDIQRLAPVLGSAAAHWLEQFGWSHEAPPTAQAEAAIQLPSDLRNPGDWAQEVLSTLKVDGTAWVTNGSYRGISALRAVVPFSHTNRVWRIHDGHVQRPDGPLDFHFTEWSATRDYHFWLRTAVDPIGVAPLFGAVAARAITENVRFTEPPLVEADLWGRWREPERTGVAGRISARKFHVRGQDVDEFEAARVGFTNGWLRVENARVRQGASTAVLPRVELDIPGRRLYFTNALSTLSPRNVTRAIGPKTARALEPFDFAVPPTVMVSGVIPTEDDLDDADIRFETRTDRFHWWRLTATNLAATVWWRGQSLIVTNLDSGFHGGRLTGNLVVDFAEPGDSIFRFDSVLSEVQLRSLLAEVAPSTNRIDGIVGGRLTVREAHSRTNGPWTGSGVARMRDGFLWDLPLFGGLSSALDRIAPGIAQSRFNSGSATFSITNRVIRSQDLEFRSASMRLQATGTVDFESRLDAIMRAEVLRDVPVLGPLVSLALSPVAKLFEYEVRGTLGKPVTSMAHVPGVLMAPLRPIQTFRNLLPGESEKPAATPAPVPSAPDAPPAAAGK